jgi:hypothetical protein
MKTMTKNRDVYERLRALIHGHPDQMRACVLSVLCEHLGEEIHAQDIADIIETTPMFGKRGGDPCRTHHVMAKMTLGYLQNRIYRMTDYRIVIDIRREMILLTTLEKAIGVKTHVFSFDNFAGHNPARSIRVDAESRYLDERGRPLTTDPKAAPRCETVEDDAPDAQPSQVELLHAVKSAATSLIAVGQLLKTVVEQLERR